MTNNLSVLLKKYAVPVIFTAMGLLMIIISAGQSAAFILAAVMMLAAAVLSILYSTGKLKTKLLYIIGVAAGIAGIFTLYMSWTSVEKTSTYQKNYRFCKNLAQQNLEDIRYAQKVYAEKNGKYISTWDELKDFINNGTVAYVDAKGVIPGKKINAEERKFLYNDNRPIDDNMNLDEAYRLSKWTDGPRYNELFKDFKRDTVQVSLLETKFMNKSYSKSREAAGYSVFSADSLQYIPFTGKRKAWKIEAADSVKMGDISFPAIYVHGTIPFSEMEGKEEEKMWFGSLTTNDMDGSWEID